MTCGEFAGQLLHAVTVAHVFHLRTRSYANHKALEELYEGLQDGVDELVECYQGTYGLIEDWPAQVEIPDGEALSWVQGLSRFVQEGRGAVGDDSELQNLVDEIQALIDRTLYKLQFLG